MKRAHTSNWRVRDQRRRNQDLPQFLSHHNRCLHCAGDYQTANCTTTQQRKTPTTNSPASGTGTSIHQNAPNTSHSSSHSNSQSPASHQHTSTIHVQTPTLSINTPQFQPNPHQAPPPPLAQNNQSTNYHTNQQQMHTPPTQPFNAQLPQSFNPMFHHCIFHNIHLLTVHLHIVLILRSC